MYKALTIALIIAAFSVGMLAGYFVNQQLHPQQIMYKGWVISSTTTTYTATKEGYQPIQGVDLPDLFADIDEANR